MPLPTRPVRQRRPSRRSGIVGCAVATLRCRPGRWLHALQRATRPTTTPHTLPSEGYVTAVKIGLSRTVTIGKTRHITIGRTRVVHVGGGGSATSDHSYTDSQVSALEALSALRANNLSDL